MNKCLQCGKEVKNKYCNVSCQNKHQNAIKFGKLRDIRINEYNKNPCKCLKCDLNLTYDQYLQNLTFCCVKCASSYNGINRIKKERDTVVCIICNIKHTTSKDNICSPECRKTIRWTAKWKDIENGLVSKRSTIKKYLIEVRGHVCSDCKNTIWKDEKIPLELHHIDGNATNNDVENLCLLCPNCHAMTANAKSKNLGFGRKARGISLG